LIGQYPYWNNRFFKPVILFIIAIVPLQQISAEGEKTGREYFDLAAAYEEKGDYANAVIYYDRAIESQKKSGKAVPYYFYSSAGYIYWNKFNDYKKALTYFLEIYNGDYPAKDKDKHIKNIAHLYYECGEYDEFLRYADEYLKIGIRDDYMCFIHDLLAGYYYECGEVEKALASAKQAGADSRIIKILEEKNVTLSFKFRFRELIQTYRKKMADSKTIFIEAPLDTYYQKLVSVKSNPAFKGMVNIRIISRSPVNVRQYTNPDDEIGYYAHEKRRRHELEYDLDNPVLVDAVTRITKDKKTMYEKIKALNGWIDVHIPHINTLKGLVNEGKLKAAVVPDISKYKNLSDVFINAAGDCVMRAGLFTGMCRILKIPARILLVYMYNGFENNSEGILGPHGLSEVYDPVQKEWIQTDLMAENRIWSNNNYSIICEYYTREDKPENYANLLFLMQDARKMGDTECGRWKVAFVE
jgi:tetratricopeptide (TPR) repeat protein